jgi:hypothetical protein
LIVFTGAKPGACVIALDKSTAKEVWKALDDPVSNSSPLVIGGWRQAATDCLDRRVRDLPESATGDLLAGTDGDEQQRLDPHARYAEGSTPDGSHLGLPCIDWI